MTDFATAIAEAGTNYRAMRAYSMAPQAVICPKCKAGFGRDCQSTGGGNSSPVPFHKARTERVADWSNDQRHLYGELARANCRKPSGAPADLVAEAEAAAKPIPAPKAKPTSPKGVRLSELQTQEIERFAYNAGKGSTSGGHLSGEHQYRQTIHALRDKGILAEGGLVNHGSEREYTLTAFGWQVYLNHRLIFRHAVGDRFAAEFATQGRCGLMSAYLNLLREAATRLRADAKPGNPNPWSNSLFLSHVADMLEREADELESVPYRVDDDWIERNYRDPLGAARAYLGWEA